MKIARVETFVLKQDLKNLEFAYSQAWYNSRVILILKITTDEGITGWGECFGPAFVHKTTIDKYYAPFIVGRNPLDREHIWDQLYNMMRDHGQFGFSVEAMSGIDIALWDIAGKYFNQPVWQLLGGRRRESIVPYATGFYKTQSSDSLSQIAEETAKYCESGFKGLKMKVGFGLDEDALNVSTVRKAAGTNVFLAIDGNHAYNPSDAIKLVDMVKDNDISWFEEPVIPEDIDGYRHVRLKSSIPISGGENVFTRWGFKRLLENQCVDIVQPDICVTGGISEVWKISSLCSVFGVRMIPHVWGSAIAMAAAQNVCFALPDIPGSLFPRDMLIEYDRTPNIFRESLAKEGIVMVDGRIYPKNKPGLGIDIDENLVSQYKCE